MVNYWWLLALLTSLVTAGYIYSNQVFKLKGSLFMVYRGLGSAVLLLPFIFFFTPIHNWQFYALCTLQGFSVAFVDNRFFRSVKAFGAEVTSSVQPLSIGLIFFLWIFINPSQFFGFMQEPLRFSAILVCLAGITISMLVLRKARTSKRAFKFLLPCLLALSIGDNLNKGSMVYGAENLPSAIYYYSLITAFVAGICNFYVYCKSGNKIKEIFNTKHFFHAFVLISIIMLLVAVKNLAMFATPNPAYASAIIYLYPLWIMFGNYIYRIKGNKTGYAGSSLKVVALLLLSVVALIVITN